jgi:arylsulfate sulfotransferase
MKLARNSLAYMSALAAALCAPAYARVKITGITPSVNPPQVLGTPVTWTVTATDSNPGPLTFQFNVAVPLQALALASDFNVGTLASGAWTSQPFPWIATGVEGTYQIQVVIKDFTSGETVNKTIMFQVTPLATGSTPVVTATANPLVALFSAPSCAAGSAMRVSFQEASGANPATVTHYQACHPPGTMNFEIAGMYPKAAYNMFSQTDTGGAITNGPTVSFTTGALPKDITFPKFTVNTPATSQTDTAQPVILQNLLQFGSIPIYPAVATDLAGNIIWYYNPEQSIFLTRPLLDGTMLTYQGGTSWNPLTTSLQLFRQIDLAGNIIKETNIGVLSQQLLAMGAADAQMCNNVPAPIVVGDACLGAFHHDAIQTLPDGQTAVLADIEKVQPAGTQGNTTGLPVDIIGDIVIVLDKNWQVVWYFDTFEHDTGCPTGGGQCQLDINRPPTLGETCQSSTLGCPPLFLLGTGIAPLAFDWLHMNAIYYWPKDGSTTEDDLVLSMRNQDWVIKVDYNKGTGTGDIIWRMGACGDYTFNNIENNDWPWFSHQHEFGIENLGAGPATVFDNGNTRYSPPGQSTSCIQGLGSGDSRGMALTIDEPTLTVTPVLSADMGGQSFGDGSAQLLSNGNYFYLLSDTFLPGTVTFVSYNIEFYPTGVQSATQVLNILAPQNYRAWRMSSLYDPPVT